jgi:hypothetical protein
MSLSREACPAEATLPARHEAGEPEVLAHVQDCPRCRALLAQHRAFLESEAGAVAPTSSQLADADASLAAALEREMSGGRASQPAAASPRTLVAEPRASWWQALFAPALRPAWGFAAVLVVAGGVYLSVRPDVQRGEVRGDSPVSTAVTTLAPVASEGVVTLSWEPVAGADRYDVVLLSQDLSELGEPVRVSEPMFVLRHDQLPAGVTAGTSLLWQVTARAGERELSHSVTAGFVAP